VPVADVGAVAGRARGGDLGAPLEGVGAVGHDRADRARSGSFAGVEVRPLRWQVPVGQGGNAASDRQRHDVGRAVIFGHVAKPDEPLQAAPAWIAGRGDQRCVVEVVAMMFLFVADGA
jgi:hypothetical protein